MSILDFIKRMGRRSQIHVPNIPELKVAMGDQKTGPKGLEIITHFEGLRLNAYRDPVGIPTIGYGHIKGVKMGDKITKEQAVKLLQADLWRFERAVNKYVTVSINQNQFDARVSFSFNVGAGALRTSTLLRKLNAGDMRGAADQFLRWNKAKGRTLSGLTRRRKAERKLFLS